LLTAAGELAPRAIEDVSTARSSVEQLAPPSELEGDHAMLVAFLDDLLASQESIRDAADAGDAVGLRAGILATREAVCSTASALSAAARPAVGFYLGSDADSPPPMCFA
jgi:hypothetical protein